VNRALQCSASVIGLTALMLGEGGSFARDKAASSEVPSRNFEFTYQVHVPAATAAASPLQVWIPLPKTDAYQTISDLKVESSVAYKVETEREYGNRLAYFEVPATQQKSAFDITLQFTTVRREHRVDLSDPSPSANSASTASLQLARYLQPDHLVPTDGMIGALAKQETEGTTTQLEKAHKIYEYVVSTMRYDKTGEGWGHGDAIFACTAKRGNCTDFHSLFIGMARASNIPAKFEIGFPLPEGKSTGDISGYHCWAEFYLKGVGWVPVDASEAWKNPAKREYFFGAHDVNRVMFTTGRDIRLSPAQHGDPVNYLVYPYAEQDGKPYAQLQSHFAFRDLNADAPGKN
jgi:transglutaminase-like putative cysteine protease